MNKKWNTVWLVGVFFLACLPAPAPALAQGAVVDRIVAIVNSEVIMLSELEEKMAPIMQRIEAANLPKDKAEEFAVKAREELLNSMVSSILARQECDKLGVKVTEGEVDEYFKRFVEKSSMTQETLEASLKRDGLTMADLMDQIRDAILMSKLRNTEVDSKIVVTDKEIQAYYEAHPEKFQGKQYYHLRYILLPMAPGADQAEKDRQAQAMEKILAMAKAGEPFPELIEKVTDPSFGGSGGDLGRFALEELTPDLAEKVQEMKPGDITAPMSAAQGIQIMWLEEVEHEGGKSLEDVRPEIEMTLYGQQVDQKYAAWVSNLEKEAYVKLMP